jgi:hypothetical protein
VPITMAFEGTYEEMQDFLTRMRNLTRLVTVEGVTYCRVPPLGQGECPIEAGAGVAETTVAPAIEAQLQVQLEAEVYFQPSDVPAGAAPRLPRSLKAHLGQPRRQHHRAESCLKPQTFHSCGRPSPFGGYINNLSLWPSPPGDRPLLRWTRPRSCSLLLPGRKITGPRYWCVGAF